MLGLCDLSKTWLNVSKLYMKTLMLLYFKLWVHLDIFVDSPSTDVQIGFFSSYAPLLPCLKIILCFHAFYDHIVAPDLFSVYFDLFLLFKKQTNLFFLYSLICPSPKAKAIAFFSSSTLLASISTPNSFPSFVSIFPTADEHLYHLYQKHSKSLTLFLCPNSGS